MNTPKTKRGRVGSTALFAPFADWSKGAEYYFGFTADADGNNVTDPEEDQPDLTEWHLEYVGGESYELEYCPAENCSTTVYRGNIPTREFFVALMSNVEKAPKFDWANDKAQATRSVDQQQACSASLWLCSEPSPSNDGQPPPESDDEGDKVTAKNLITAETAAEIAVETSNREMNDGDELEVWVWQPGGVAQAAAYFVRVSWHWSFSGRPNDLAHSQKGRERGPDNT